MSFIPELEIQSSATIRTRQEVLFQKAIGYAFAFSPFYKKHFSGKGIAPEEIKTLDDITRLPVTTKDDLQLHNWDFLCVGKNKIAEYTSTSGTMGKPVTIALTKNDVDRLAYNEYISFVCADGTPADLFQLTVTLDRQFMAGIAYYEGIKKLGASLVRVGPGLPAMQWETIQRLRPTVLVVVPSFLLKLIDFANENKIDLNASSVKSAVCIGESIRTPDLKPNALALRIEKQWNLKLYGTYASTEMQTAFTECSYSNGGHHHPELLFIEILDENNLPVAPGTPGEVTITTFGIEGMPLIRYKTGDIAVAFNDPCNCGRTTSRLGPVLGRKQQMIKLKGTTIYPQGVFEILNQFPLIENYVVEVSTGDAGTDELKLILLAGSRHWDQITALLKASFQSHLKVMPVISFSESREIEKLQFPNNSRKARKFIDLREAF